MMKRLLCLCMMLGVCWFTVGCGGSQPPPAEETNLEIEVNLEADMAEQKRMMQEAAGGGTGAGPGAADPANPAQP